MVETYGAHECRVYYVEEATYGETPTNPTMLGLPAESVEPTFNPSNVKVRGIGSRDLQLIKKGSYSNRLKIAYPLPSDAPINFLQHHMHNVGLSIQVLYYKGAWSSATDVISLLYQGCRFDKVTVECKVEDVVRASVELFAKNLLVGNAKLTGATYNDYVGAVAFHESYVKKNTSVLDRVTDWKWSIENNLREVAVIKTAGANVLKYLPYRQRNLLGESNFEFESNEELLETTTDTEFSLEFGLGGSNKAVFSNCKWDNTSTPTKIEDLVFCKAQFAAKTVAIS